MGDGCGAGDGCGVGDGVDAYPHTPPLSHSFTPHQPHTSS